MTNILTLIVGKHKGSLSIELKTLMVLRPVILSLGATAVLSLVNKMKRYHL